MKKYKVVQWATGYTGIYALKYILLNPALQLVGLKVFSADKVSKDAGEICGLPPVGVKATTSIDDILKLDAECVIYTPGMYDMQHPSVPSSIPATTKAATKCANRSKLPAARATPLSSPPVLSPASWAM